jgi:hypothetical protein
MFDMCQCPSFRDRAIEHAGEFFIGHPDLWHETPCGYALRWARDVTKALS